MRIKRVVWQISLIFIVTFSNTTSALEVNEDGAIIFGFLPILSTTKLVKRFAPLVQFTSKVLGKPVRFETAPSYKEFIRRTNEDKLYDILFTAPHFYYLAQREAGHRVIVKVTDKPMRAIIVSPKGSVIKTLDDLRNKSISTVDALSLGTVLLRAHLIKNGINPDADLTLVETPTHNASLMSAFKGFSDSASLMIPPFKRAKKQIRDSMQIISKTDGTPHMPISVSPRISPVEKEKLKVALIDLVNSQRGKKLLKHLSWPGFVNATQAEYDKIKWAVDQLPEK